MASYLVMPFTGGLHLGLPVIKLMLLGKVELEGERKFSSGNLPKEDLSTFNICAQLSAQIMPSGVRMKPLTCQSRSYAKRN